MCNAATPFCTGNAAVSEPSAMVAAPPMAQNSVALSVGSKPSTWRVTTSSTPGSEGATGSAYTCAIETVAALPARSPEITWIFAGPKLLVSGMRTAAASSDTPSGLTETPLTRKRVSAGRLPSMWTCTTSPGCADDWISLMRGPLDGGLSILSSPGKWLGLSMVQVDTTSGWPPSV